MKKGVIFYITEGKDEIRTDDAPDLRELLETLGAQVACVATSESEIAYGWWHLLVRGMQQVSCTKAVYDPRRNILMPQGTPLRLCG